MSDENKESPFDDLLSYFGDGIGNVVEGLVSELLSDKKFVVGDKAYATWIDNHKNELPGKFKKIWIEKGRLYTHFKSDKGPQMHLVFYLEKDRVPELKDFINKLLITGSVAAIVGLFGAESAGIGKHGFSGYFCDNSSPDIHDPERNHPGKGTVEVKNGEVVLDFVASKNGDYVGIRSNITKKLQNLDYTLKSAIDKFLGKD